MESSEAKRAGAAEHHAADLAGALHEVSNALTVVLGWLEQAGAAVPSGPAREAVEIARTHARIGHSVARRAIGADVEDAAVGRSALRLLEQAALGVSCEAARAEVKITVEGTREEDALLRSAPTALQVLINLLLNAISFSPRGATVRLGMRPDAEGVLFFVEDGGPGIALERAETLFTHPISTRSGGAGIGLRHAHLIARAQGGELCLADTGPTGTRFELRWPTGDAPSGTMRRPVRPPSLEGARIVVMEDDPAVLSLIEFGLGARGARVVAVSGVAELLRVLERGLFDAVLVDLSPVGPGPTAALRRFRQLGGGSLGIVVISGSVAPDVEPDAVDAWVRKPFEVGELVDALAGLLKGT